MIDADLVSVGERAAHPAADGDRRGPERLQRQRQRRTARSPVQEPSGGEQREGGSVDERVLGRAFLAPNSRGGTL